MRTEVARQVGTPKWASPSGHPRVGIPEWRILVDESVVARKQGDRKTALAKARAVYDKAKELEGERGGGTLCCGGVLGRALFEEGRPKEAQPHLERAIAIMDPMEEALKLTRGELEVLDERFVEPHQRLAEACEIMALILEAAGHSDEASTFEKRAKVMCVAL